MTVRLLIVFIYSISLNAQNIINIDSLTSELVHGIDNDSVKFRAIYEFIEGNIVYDNEAYKNGNRRINRSSSDVLSRGKAVCWGYSELFREMCSAADLKAATIVEYAPTDTPARFLDDANHAWNALYVNGKWNLLDITWNIGLRNGVDEFMLTYGVDYLLTPPEIFINNHFPILPMWQLSHCPISWIDFNNDALFMRASGGRCGFNYESEILDFFKMSYLEQLNQQAEYAHTLNNTSHTKRDRGHSMIDIAIEKKEIADSLFEVGAYQSSLEYFESAQEIFAGAQQYCQFYDWQEQAYIFNALNLGQSLYQVYYSDQLSHNRIINQFEIVLSLIDLLGRDEDQMNELSAVANEHIKVLNSSTLKSK